MMELSIIKEVRYVVGGDAKSKAFKTEIEAIEYCIGQLVESEVETGMAHVIGPAIVKLGSQIEPLLSKASHPKNEAKKRK